ncbi:RSP_2648 family PIN domain-containing protein [Yoonia sp. 2307UL14-13]|uniref:RSP_2648 family PIN domain-containing protein n=1 Tax=Yoonia sp. 2307UL14-13 TaxID=3126506 RepID=UPI003098F15A
MRVLIDTCVLYPTVMREVVLGCAAEGLFEVRWSSRILEEWQRAVVKLGPAQVVIAEGEIAALGAAFPDAVVPEHAGLEQRLWLPDPNDIHVLASAVGGSCDAIMTINAKDFPGNVLAEEGLFRVDPDAFLRGLLEEVPDQVRGVAERVLAQANAISDRPWEMRALMKKARLPRLGKALS